MQSSDKMEARLVARLCDPRTGAIIGNLYLWEDGEADPMWFDEEVSDAIADPLPDESSDWKNWSLRTADDR